MQKQTFSSVRKRLIELDRNALISVVGELYALNSNNRDFLSARFVSSENSMEKYKKTIKKALDPNVMSSSGKVSFRDANKAISECRKAIGAGVGFAELIVFAFECGNNFTCEYGDMDESFYGSLTRLFVQAKNAVKELDPSEATPFIDRLSVAVDKADCIGWGYHDEISSIFYDAFSHE